METYIYVTQQKNKRNDLRCKHSIEGYIEDIKIGQKLGDKILVSYFTEDEEVWGDIVSICSDFAEGLLSLEEMREKISVFSNVKQLA